MFLQNQQMWKEASLIRVHFFSLDMLVLRYEYPNTDFSPWLQTT